MKQELLKWVEQNPKGTFTYKELKNHFSNVKEKEFSRCVEELEKEYLLFREHNSRYYTRNQAGYLEGILHTNKKGYGYIILDEYTYDIPREDLQGALDQDIVLVKKRYYDAYVVAIMEHAHETFVGTIEKKGKGYRILPDNPKMDLYPILWDNEEKRTVVSGMKAQFQIVKYGKVLQVALKEILGHEDDPGIEILSILYGHGIQPLFPPEVKEEVEKIPSHITLEELQGRKDLTKVVTVTIDGDGAKDFDDAVSISKTEEGWNLLVSIADVSHYVQPQTALDEEAYQRGFSTYVVDRVVPMLPHELSNEICSLNPEEVRLTITCDMHISKEGEITSFELYPSYISSSKRMTYAKVNQLYDGKGEEDYLPYQELLVELKNCANQIRNQRHNQGAIEFEENETEIRVDKQGKPIWVGIAERGIAERVIEDCMIVANVCVARCLVKEEIPGIYRIHETPSSKDIHRFQDMSYRLGNRLDIPKDGITPMVIQKYLQSIQKEEEYPLLSRLLLRSMPKARYDENCIGHFALAEKEYLHFTSPIRRYSDLIVHRMLRKYLFDKQPLAYEDLGRIADHISSREREIVQAEWDAEDYKKAEYMLDHLGEEAVGMIVSTTSHGFFVRLENTIEGYVQIGSLHDDDYYYQQEEFAWVGRKAYHQYRIGQMVKVRAVAANPQERSIEFSIIQEPSFQPQHSHKPKQKGKKNGKTKR